MHSSLPRPCLVLVAVAMQSERGCAWALDLVTDTQIVHAQGRTQATLDADALADGVLDLVQALAPAVPAVALVCNDGALAAALHQRRNGVDRALRLVVACDELSQFPLLAACTRRLVTLLASRTE